MGQQIGTDNAGPSGWCDCRRDRRDSAPAIAGGAPLDPS